MNIVQPTTKWHSTESVADLFGLSARHIRRMIAVGDLKAVQFGRVYRVSDEALQQMAEARIVQPRSHAA
jgi:excisionase family DNA binding protein